MTAYKILVLKCAFPLSDFFRDRRVTGLKVRLFKKLLPTRTAEKHVSEKRKPIGRFGGDYFPMSMWRKRVKRMKKTPQAMQPKGDSRFYKSHDVSTDSSPGVIGRVNVLRISRICSRAF